jgi:hypothetical protein
MYKLGYFGLHNFPEKNKHLFMAKEHALLPSSFMLGGIIIK